VQNDWPQDWLRRNLALDSSSGFQDAKLLPRVPHSVRYTLILQCGRCSLANRWTVLFTGLAKYQNSSIDQALYASYVSATIDCPCNIQWVHSANGLGDAEAGRVTKREVFVLDALEGYLDHLCLEDFKVQEFAERMKESTASTLSLLVWPLAVVNINLDTPELV